jgi:hypothetical protein
MKEVKITSNAIINRHKARLLQNLEDVNCPQVYREAVTTALNWLRSDINENERNGVSNERNEDRENAGNR